MTKFCKRCNAETERYADGACKPCRRGAAARWYDNNRERSLAKAKERYVKDPEAARMYKRKQMTGWTQPEFDTAWLRQEGRCAICGKQMRQTGDGKDTASADHCHKTGKKRGLLCRVCNSGIGLLKDSPDLLRRAAEYCESACAA